MTKVYKWIDAVWGWISETVFVRFEFDLPVEQLREMHRQGRLVFAMVHAGIIDWLVLSSWCRTQGMGAILVGNRKRMLMFAKPLYFLQILFRSRSYADLYLNSEPGPRIFFCRPKERKKLYDPTESEKVLAEVYSRSLVNPDLPAFQLVPVFIRWRKHVRGEGRKLSEYFFGLSSNPNWIGKTWYLFRKRTDSTVRALSPVALAPTPFDPKDGLEPSDNLGESEPVRVARATRRKILVEVFQEMRVVLGPRFQSPPAVKEALMKDPEIQRLVDEIAVSEGVDRKKVMMRTYQYLTEIAANYNFRFIEVMYVVLTWLFTKVFEGMNTKESDLQMVRDTMKTKPVVFVSCHRSHLDYMVVPYVLFLKDMVTPFIAAGVNLAFWPVGPFLRMGGAFFIRRSFRGNPLYSLCLRKYIEYLVKHRFTVKFFIEGTRSRSGKMLPPAYGLLKMVMETSRSKVVDDIALIPVSICYDEVLEEGSYTKELGGAQKEKESATGLIKSRQLIKRNIGKVYVRFAPPIFTNEVYRNAEETALDPTLTLQKTAFQLSKSINDVTPITPKSIVSSILLTHRLSSLSLEEILRNAEGMANYAEFANVELSVVKGDGFRRAVEQTVRKLQKSGVVGVSETVPRGFYCDPKKRITLNFYKNNAIHCYFIPSIAIFAVVHSLRQEEWEGQNSDFYDSVVREAVALRNILKFEFFFSPTPVFVNEIKRALEFFAGQKVWEELPRTEWLEGIQNYFKEHDDMSIYLGLLGDILESYKTSAQYLQVITNTTADKKGLLAKLLKHGEGLKERGDLLFPESNSLQNYTHSLLLFENFNFLKSVKVDDKVSIEVSEWTTAMDDFVNQAGSYLETISKNPGDLQ